MLNVQVLVIPDQTTLPLTPPPTTTASQANSVSESEAFTTVLQRLAELEKQKNPALPAQYSFTHAQTAYRAAKSLSKLELKKILFDKMDKSRSYMTHDNHQELYDTLLNSIMLDKTIASGNVNPDKPSSTDKLVNAEEPLYEAEMDMEEHIRDDFKQPPRPPTLDPEWNKDKVVDDGPEHTWLNDLVNAEKDSLTFDELMATPIDFSKFAMNRLKLDKITKADLVGPVYKLLKGTCKSSIKLEYNMDQFYNARTNQLDWKNPECNRCPYDLCKPLILQGSLGHLTILVDFFFNYDLEYLRIRNLKRKYTILITKTKAAKSQINRFSKHDVYSTMKILSMVSVNVDKQFRIAIQKRVEDVQLGVESYRKKLNITKPQKYFPGMSSKESYTRSYDPKGIVYLNLRECKGLMRADEIYKFYDGTLQSVHDTLHYGLLNFKLGYNKDMPRRKWTDKEQNRTNIIVNLIDKQLLERRIMWSLERLVGGRKVEMDYRQLTWTE
ncbi:hypothetical protein Tco_1533704 [Tanacetum coccineum]